MLEERIPPGVTMRWYLLFLTACIARENVKQDQQVAMPSEIKKVFSGPGPQNLIALAAEGSSTLLWDVVADASTYAL